MTLRHVDPARRRGALYRGYVAFVGSSLGAWISERLVWKVDPHVLRLTGGRVGAAWPIPNALLQTRGARTGAARANGVIYFHDGPRVTIIASKLGADHHPAWFHNLVADPDVVLGGVPMRARVVEDEAERHRLWTLADRVFMPYESYRERAAKAGRTIPIVQLEPR